MCKQWQRHVPRDSRGKIVTVKNDHKEGNKNKSSEGRKGLKVKTHAATWRMCDNLGGNVVSIA